MSEVRQGTDMRPTNKWWAATVATAVAILTALMTLIIHDTAWQSFAILVIGGVGARAQAYIAPNEPPGGVPPDLAA